MKTLGEIIEAVRDGERPDYEDLRYAICAMSALAVFDRQAFIKLAEAEETGKKPFLTTIAAWQWKESFGRWLRAMTKPPKEYVGWNNDPDNPEFLARLKTAQRFMAKFAAKFAGGTAP